MTTLSFSVTTSSSILILSSTCLSKHYPFSWFYLRHTCHGLTSEFVVVSKVLHHCPNEIMYFYTNKHNSKMDHKLHNVHIPILNISSQLKYKLSFCFTSSTFYFLQCPWYLKTVITTYTNFL